MQPNHTEYCLFWVSQWCLPSSEWASWVQAIGSILAILGALLLGERQGAHARAVAEKQVYEARKLEANKRHLDDLLKTEIIQQLFAEANTLCAALGNLHQMRNPQPPIYRAIERLRELEQSFRALPAFELPGSGVAVGVLSAPAAIEDLRTAARACTDSWVQLSGHREADIPSRLRVEFLRAHEQAAGLARSGVGICEMQISQLRKLMPVRLEYPFSSVYQADTACTGKR
jgi:hypothetical protein